LSESDKKQTKKGYQRVEGLAGKNIRKFTRQTPVVRVRSD